MLLQQVVYITVTASFYGLPNTELIKMQTVQNVAARLVTSIPKYYHFPLILYDLHRLLLGPRSTGPCPSPPTFSADAVSYGVLTL